MCDVAADGFGECDEELKHALIAAFGDDVMNLLDARESDEFQSDASDIALVPGPLELRDSDSPRVRWAKNLYRSIYAPKKQSHHGHSIGDPSESALHSIRCVVFSVGHQLLAISLNDVREIARHPRITELPLTDSWLRGVTSLRGEILSVTDLRKLLEIEGPRPLPEEKIIVIHSRDQSIATGLAVDRVIGIRKAQIVPENEIPDGFEMNDRIAGVAGGWVTFDESAAVLIDCMKLLARRELMAFS